MAYSLREIVGITIWWNQGTKMYRDKRWKNTAIYPVDVSSSNPDVIRSFLNFLRIDIGVTEDRLKAQIQIHVGENQEEALRYWSRATKIPLERFTKTIIRPKSSREGSRLGTCKVRYTDKETYLKLERVWEKILAQTSLETGIGRG